MVIQNPTLKFLGKVNEFFEGKTTPERQRSGVVHCTFRHRSDVVQATVQAGSTEMILNRLNRMFQLVVCLKNIFQPGASCGFLENLHKNYFFTFHTALKYTRRTNGTHTKHT